MSTAKRALVTGAAGFVGSSLVDRLLSAGWGVVGIDSFEDYYSREVKEANIRASRSDRRFTLLEANLLELGSETAGAIAMCQALARADVVFHLAAQAGVRSSWGSDFGVYTDNNVLATQRLLEACRGTGVKSFVYASSSSVYGDATELPMSEDANCRPFSPYGVSKLAGEQLCRLYARNFGLPTTSLRFFTVYGPRQRPDMGFHRFIRAALEGRTIHVYGDGTQTRDFTYVDDILDGIVAAVGAAPGSVYNIGGGSRVSLADALSLVGDSVGVPLRLEYADAQSGDVRDTFARIDKARDDLGYSPRVALHEGIAREVQWLAAVVDREKDPSTDTAAREGERKWKV